jgi:hypothetical protein
MEMTMTAPILDRRQTMQAIAALPLLAIAASHAAAAPSRAWHRQRVTGSGHAKASVFFSEEKNQKTFAYWRRGIDPGPGRPRGTRGGLRLFSKKKCFLTQAPK